jgi:hypothetical protein
MFANHLTRRLVQALAATFASMLALAIFGCAAALAYPPLDGPDMHGRPPTLPEAAAAGSPTWAFLLVAGVTAAVAVFTTLTVLRVCGRIVDGTPDTQPAPGIELLSTR